MEEHATRACPPKQMSDDGKVLQGIFFWSISLQLERLEPLQKIEDTFLKHSTNQFIYAIMLGSISASLSAPKSHNRNG